MGHVGERCGWHDVCMGIDRATRDELTWVRDDYDELVRCARPADLPASTAGTRWTNRELLFHMWFGQRIARVLVPVAGGASRVPAAVGRRYAGLLSTATRPYDWVNYAAAVSGARVVSLQRADRWMNRDTEALLRWADTASDHELDRGMAVPPGWDPYFTDWMSRRDFLDWAPKHYRHHRAQLTLT